MIIMPSTPRLSTPARSAMSSPAAASSKGVDAAMIERMMASSRPIRGLWLWHDETNAIEDHGIAGEHVEQQYPLEHLGQIQRNLHRNLRLLAADEGERQEQAGDQDADRIQPAEKRDDDGGEAIAGRDVGAEVSDRAGDLDDAGKAGERSRDEEGEDHQPVGIETSETGRLGGRADHAYFKALYGAAEHNRRHRHDDQRNDRPEMHAASFDQDRHRCDRIEIRRRGEIIA